MSMTAAELRAFYSVDESGLDKSIKGIPGKIKASAAMLAGAGLAIGGALGAGLMTGMDNERINDKLAAQLGLSGPESARVGKVAGTLYAQAYGDSLGGVNDAVAAVMSSINGMRGASSKDLKEITRDALNFATAMDVDVSEAATSAGALVNTGLVKNAQEAFDLLTVGAQKVGPAMVAPLLDATNEYSKHFAMLGFDGKSAMSALATAAAGGEIAIDKAGDAVKEFGIRATDLNDTGAQQALKDLGLSGTKMADDLLAGGVRAQGATQQIAQALLGIQDPGKRAAEVGALFGTQIEDIGKNNIPKFLSAMAGMAPGMENVAGASDRLDATLNSNASGALESFKRQAQQAVVTLANNLLPAVRDVGGFLASNFGPAVKTVGGFLTGTLVPGLKSVFGFLSEHTTTVKIIAGLIASVLVPALILWGVQSTIAAYKSVAGWVTAAIASETGAAAQKLSCAQVVIGWIAMGVQSLIQAAKMAAAWVLAMGPVGWVIAAVVGLVALIVANWDTVKRWTVSAWNAVSGAVSGAWRAVTGAVSAGISNVVSWVAGLPGRVMGAIGNLGSLLLNAGRDLLTGLWNGITGAGSWLLRKVGAFFGSLLPGWVRDMLGIHSPSTVFAEMGRYLMLGMASGIEGEQSTAVRAAQAAAAAITDAMQVTPPDLSLMANRQAMNALTARRPAGVGVSSRSPASAADAVGAPSFDKLFNVENMTLVEGDAQDVARRLDLQLRTRPWA